MRDYTRRNRNIGTSKQGYGQNNKLTVRDFFVEKLVEYKKQRVVINNHEFLFITENLQDGFQYSCSVDDIAECLNLVPECDYGDLKFIVFRQPKRKERILEPVWGKLMYSFEFENQFYPAIIIESFKVSDRIKWPKKLSITQSVEFNLLLEEGHKFTDKGKYYEVELEFSAVRNTQLKRTIFHEIGHYVHYLTIVERQGNENESFEEWENRYNSYFSIAKREKESFANKYASAYQ